MEIKIKIKPTGNQNQNQPTGNQNQNQTHWKSKSNSTHGESSLSAAHGFHRLAAGVPSVPLASTVEVTGWKQGQIDGKEKEKREEGEEYERETQRQEKEEESWIQIQINPSAAHGFHRNTRICLSLFFVFSYSGEKRQAKEENKKVEVSGERRREKLIK
jgi:hypothetical protein